MIKIVECPCKSKCSRPLAWGRILQMYFNFWLILLNNQSQFEHLFFWQVIVSLNISQYFF